jgi:putative acetyltransferase
MTADDVRTRFSYNTWANRRLLEALDSVPAEVFTREMGDAVQHVVNHSSYLREKVVALLRQRGFTVPSTDFLDFMRQETSDPRKSDAPERSATAIRSATTTDADAIASLLAEAFVEFEPLYTAGGYRATTPNREEIQQRLADGPIWVAEQEGRIAGTVSAIVRPDGVYVRSMAVARVARGCGIGRLMLKHVQDFAAEQDRHRLYLSTTPFLSSAIRLYEQAGFMRTSAPPYELFGTALFTMEKWSNRADVR